MVVKALARHTDPSTSHMAAESVDATRLEGLVMDVINCYGTTGCISDEVRHCLPWLSHSTVTPRFRPLTNKGLIVRDSSKRKGDSGKQQLVMWTVPNYITLKIQEMGVSIPDAN